MPGPASNPLVVFDGECNLCNRSVRFILDHEVDGDICFAASLSPPGQNALRGCGLGCQPGTIVLIESGRCYTKSDATIRLARHLRKPWNLLGLLVMIPAPIRDLAYDFIATNRLRISHGMPHCRTADRSVVARFLT